MSRAEFRRIKLQAKDLKILNFGEKKSLNLKILIISVAKILKMYVNISKMMIKKHAIHFPKLLCTSEAPYLEPFVHQNMALSGTTQ